MFVVIRRIATCLLLCAALTSTAVAKEADAPIQTLLQSHGAEIKKSSRKSIGPAIDALAASGTPDAQTVLERWQAKEMWFHKDSGLFVFGQEADGGDLALFDVAGGGEIGTAPKKDYKQLKPNSGIRGMIAAALVQFQLNAPDPATRAIALDAIERDAEVSHLAALRASIGPERDLTLKARKERIERLLTIRFAEDDAERIAAIRGFSGDLSVDLRAALNPLVQTKLEVATDLPADAKVVRVGKELAHDEAYALLVERDLAPPRTDPQTLRETLIANIEGEEVAGVKVATLDTDDARAAVYATLAASGNAQPLVTDADVTGALERYVFFEVFTGAPVPVALAAQAALHDIEAKLALSQTVDLALDGLSLASIYFLAAIGLAITFGVMGVINMAHGEFIMMGAYTGYVVQLFVPDYTLSILLAIPLAFAVTFGAGVAMERLVIRWLYHRPLETLLATFGVSIALQQLAKNIFGTQARPLTAPGWLDGSLVFNDVIAISYIRIAIFVLAMIFLAVFLFVMNRTRLGLEVRAVTQNPRMASSMGINPDRINMLTFGFGSGIAGIAGVAIGLYAKVTSEMGADYIVQSFMTVVVGGVGNIWGTLLGATLVGTLQKGIEWLNPSNTLAAQTYMILFIILFIQFRPRGIIALKGRAAEA
ncbi:urea ABC transporter permease subunit UrtB [Sulfitobacter sp. JBTF-M27]|uniref:Urea ABC transporter permease subunit UrtB n=1 Tax=Sulfitobacter sediminilitoris TaxID=2698830 RepID=A0A6P0C987_9RHOB|nr:urea ABC transporter permease subunit UrtB [Sulfitobacter sediminilitoris]NEK21666.1 urea ABC transporter permease subunit UrtB [Sulfitobacter sediminilitoris]